MLLQIMETQRDDLVVIHRLQRSHGNLLPIQSLAFTHVSHTTSISPTTDGELMAIAELMLREQNYTLRFRIAPSVSRVLRPPDEAAALRQCPQRTQRN